MKTEKFEIKVDDWKLVGIENAKFVLNEAQAYVTYLSDVSSRITARAFSIIVLFFPIIGLFIAFIVKQSMNMPNSNQFLTFYTIAITIALIVIMYGLGKIVRPRLFKPIGRAPKEICNNELLGVTLEKELSMIAIVFNEIENCQDKIDYNEQQNEERTKNLDFYLKSIGFLFALSTMVTTIYFCITLF